ncbi:MAG TPA: M24 family metallopeptidase [Candidatus Andersenbacteria bacterium]|nr:M24 family metallopeptidase [Candidatus Andersenbacteria bacterium]
MNSAFVLVDSKGPEMLYRTDISASDPFIYIAPTGKTPIVFFDAREYDVQLQKIQSLGNTISVERLEPYAKSSLAETLVNILQKYNIDEAKVSPNMPHVLACAIQDVGIQVSIYDFASERDKKTEDEIQKMIIAQRVNESALLLVWNILAESSIQDSLILYQGQVLTSEYMKSRLKIHLLEQGYDCPEGIIVASGEQTARPHDEGSGPLLPHECIIVDIFPRSEKTGFFADMTRTFVKGKAKKELQNLFQVVQDVQKEIADSISVGELCSTVHKRTVEAFKKRGHSASPEKGFMHGTGHSLGLSIHEGPRLNSSCDRIIEPGMTLTVEPGLYYPGIGGVRIEDVIVFHPDGTKENITQFNKPLYIL